MVKVTDWAVAAVPCTVLPNVRLDGVSDTPGAVPVPLSAMIWVPPLALSVMVITPVRTPLAVGVNVTAMVQLPETATGDVAEQLVLGSSAKSPEAIRELMVRALLPVLIKVTDCAVAVVPITVLPKVRLEGFSDTPGAVPLPVRVMVCVPPLASSLMVTTPVRVPLAVGVNVTAMVHVLATATGDEIEQVVLGSKAKSPLASSAVMVRGLLPELVNVTDCVAAVVPTTVLPKVRLDGLSEIPGAIPVPLSATFCVPPLTLSLMVTIPARGPSALGVNVAAMMQLAPAATGVEVEHVELASSAKSPLALMAVIVSEVLPVFVNTTDCAAPVVSTTVLPKVRLDGVSDIPAAMPVP